MLRLRDIDRLPTCRWPASINSCRRQPEIPAEAAAAGRIAADYIDQPLGAKAARSWGRLSPDEVVRLRRRRKEGIVKPTLTLRAGERSSELLRSPAYYRAPSGHVRAVSCATRGPALAARLCDAHR